MFRSYWQSHGLEFNDPGISYHESLALFGYPISEEYIDPDTGLVTQYFERARFEDSSITRRIRSRARYCWGGLGRT
jgi:hypothetical protein